MFAKLKKDDGFTLLELIIALAIAVIATASVFNFYIRQQKSYVTQDRVTEMQQNLRVAMEIMVREIRMAGFDQTLEKTAGAGVLDADTDSIQFTMDRDMDGDCIGDTDENITYSIFTDADGVRNLGRRDATTGVFQSMAPYIEALGFAYGIDNNNDGLLDTDGGQIIWAIDNGGTWFDLDTNEDGDINETDVIPGGENTGIVVNLDDIRAVRIWLLVHAADGEEDYLNMKTYIVGNQKIDPIGDADATNDDERMRILSTIVKLRNMGL